MERSPTTVTESSASGHAKASKILWATLLNAVVSIPLRLWRFVIAILCGLLANAFLLVGRLRIVDPVVINAGEYPVEALGDLVQVLEGQLTLVQLAVHEDVVDDLLHQPLDARRGGIDQGARGGLHAVRQKHQARLPGLRLGAGVAEVT